MASVLIAVSDRVQVQVLSLDVSSYCLPYTCDVKQGMLQPKFDSAKCYVCLVIKGLTLSNSSIPVIKELEGLGANNDKNIQTEDLRHCEPRTNLHCFLIISFTAASKKRTKLE
ncbi:hypothetical protein L195_g033070 [Trifolium pratense]|uniref:Uncharacterized protein n=1 Tax=Trifolium pratense TaxID=57577 RepID=A0A2K3LEY8_TRIPR|nr:hypothetical protein L195_g033070 [Trifolium pratense]